MLSWEFGSALEQDTKRSDCLPDHPEEGLPSSHVRPAHPGTLHWFVDDLSLFVNDPPLPDGEKVDDMGQRISYGPHAPQHEACQAARQARFTHSTSCTPLKTLVSITSLTPFLSHPIVLDCLVFF